MISRARIQRDSHCGHSVHNWYCGPSTFRRLSQCNARPSGKNGRHFRVPTRTPRRGRHASESRLAVAPCATRRSGRDSAEQAPLTPGTTPAASESRSRQARVSPPRIAPHTPHAAFGPRGPPLGHARSSQPPAALKHVLHLRRPWPCDGTAPPAARSDPRPRLMMLGTRIGVWFQVDSDVSLGRRCSSRVCGCWLGRLACAIRVTACGAFG